MRTTSVLLLAASGFLFSLQAFSQQPDAKEIMKKNFTTEKVSAFTGSTEMVLINSQGQKRYRKLDVWSKNSEEDNTSVLMRFTTPSDIKGTGFLQVEHTQGASKEDDVWIYLPALGKVRRIQANNKRDSFFGSDFSYGDITVPLVEDYHHRFLGEEKVEGKDCYIIESVPVSSEVMEESGYSKKIVWVDKVNFLQYRAEYYDLAGDRLKTQNIDDYTEVEPARHRWIASGRQMVNHQTGHKTVYSWKNVKLQKDLADSFFTVRTLGK